MLEKTRSIAIIAMRLEVCPCGDKPFTNVRAAEGAPPPNDPIADLHCSIVVDILNTKNGH